jgi:hypothetical protein
MWLLLPGLLIHLIQAVHLLPDWMGFLIMGAATCGIVAVGTVLAARNKRSAIIVSVIIGLLYSANSWIGYRLFLF